MRAKPILIAILSLAASFVVVAVADDFPRLPLNLDMLRPMQAYELNIAENTAPGVRVYLNLDGMAVTNMIDWSGSLYLYRTTNNIKSVVSTNNGAGYIDFDFGTNHTDETGTHKSQIILTGPLGQRVIEWSRGEIVILEGAP